jgi:pantetheine-phosphate adenylyltransferase
MKRAVYAGSFDPPTNGHLWVIEEGSKLFDELIVAVGINPAKKYTFSVEERRKMLEEITENLPNVKVSSFENMFLVKYAASVGAETILRGIRNDGDYKIERERRYVNSDLEPRICTVLLIPPREKAEISSSMVKELIGPAGWEEVVRKYVPSPVYKKLLQRFKSGT